MKTSTIRTLTLAACLAVTANLHAAEKAKTGEMMDQKFVKRAAGGGMLEVTLGGIAKEKAMSPEVKSFGEMMATDHSKANEELKALAEKKSLKIPAKLPPKHQAKVDMLSKLSGAAFDKAYVDDMVADHKQDIAEFEEAAKSAKDAEIKAFAEKTLPTLRAHLEAIEKIQSMMPKKDA